MISIREVEDCIITCFEKDGITGVEHLFEEHALAYFRCRCLGLPHSDLHSDYLDAISMLWKQGHVTEEHLSDMLDRLLSHSSVIIRVVTAGHVILTGSSGEHYLSAVRALVQIKNTDEGAPDDARFAPTLLARHISTTNHKAVLAEMLASLLSIIENRCFKQNCAAQVNKLAA